MRSVTYKRYIEALRNVTEKRDVT